MTGEHSDDRLWSNLGEGQNEGRSLVSKIVTDESDDEDELKSDDLYSDKGLMVLDGLYNWSISMQWSGYEIKAKE